MPELPTVITDSHIWQNTLGQSANTDSMEALERLRTAFINFRLNAGHIANEIRRDLPQLTLHNLTHIDALWETASTITGEDFFLTPTEGFVLGGAFLLHDLGMALPSVDGGIAALKNDPRWADLVTYEYQVVFDRDPTPEETQDPTDDIHDRVLLSILQQVHASSAERLISIPFKPNNTSDPIYLIDETELRRNFGQIVGLIAHSHWWTLSEVERQFQRTIGAPHWCPRTWTLDPLKIACVLRCADAAQVDARRAPKILNAVSDVPNTSSDHWTFQEKLNKPYIEDDALVITTGHAFNMQEAPAWWLCFETLRMVDRELGSVDALFADKGSQRFAARRVAGVEDPNRLVSYIHTDGWIPINATIHVTDLPRVIKSVGGDELYGKRPDIALRELIQNATDAIHARRVYENREQDYGSLSVSLKKHDDGFDWLEVSDNGIGMSQNVLTGFLLDFGRSFWGSSEMQREFPGLLSSGLKQTGKYGIGFFAVFMIADQVQVITRRSDAAAKDTIVLEFSSGLRGRPILREASSSERLLDGGTIIRLKLQTEPHKSGGLLHNLGERSNKDLSELCVSVCPASAVNLNIEEDTGLKELVRGGDWKTMDPFEFLKRMPDMELHDKVSEDDIDKFCHLAANNLRTLVDDEGKVVGRALVTVGFALVPGNHTDKSGIVTIGGLHACSLYGIAGILEGTSMRASRDTAKPIVDDQELRRWATEQSELVPSLWKNPIEQAACAKYIRLCGGDTGRLPICQHNDEWYSADDIRKLENLPDVVILLDGFVIDYQLRHIGSYTLNDNVFIVHSSGIPGLLQCRIDWPQGTFTDFAWGGGGFNKTLGGVLVESLSEVWNVDVESVKECNDFEKETDVIIGTYNSGDLRERALIIKKP